MILSKHTFFERIFLRLWSTNRKSGKFTGGIVIVSPEGFCQESTINTYEACCEKDSLKDGQRGFGAIKLCHARQILPIVLKTLEMVDMIALVNPDTQFVV